MITTSTGSETHATSNEQDVSKLLIVDEQSHGLATVEKDETVMATGPESKATIHR